MLNVVKVKERQSHRPGVDIKGCASVVLYGSVAQQRPQHTFKHTHNACRTNHTHIHMLLIYTDFSKDV